MSTDLDAELRTLGSALRASSPPITLTELRDHQPGTVLVSLDGVRPANRRRTLAMLGVLCVAAAATIAVIVARPTTNPSVSVAAVDLEPHGAMILDPVPPGWTIAGAEIDDPAGTGTEVPDRWYLFDPADPGPVLKVTTIDLDVGSPGFGVSGKATYPQVVDSGDGGRATSRIIDGYWFVATGYGMSDDEIRAAAATGSLDPDRSHAGHVDVAALPAGMSAWGDDGFQVEFGWVSREGANRPIPKARWTRGNSVFWFAVVDQPLIYAGVPHVGAATVEQVTVRGNPADLIVYAPADEYLTLVQVIDGRTLYAGGNIPREELLAMAETLRAATTADWDAATASAEPRMATRSPETGMAEPGTRIPTGVTQFPLIDESVIPDTGLSTYASYGYPSVGVDQPGATWKGVLGIAGRSPMSGLIAVTVSDTSAAERLPTVPGRRPDLAEYDYGNGTDLVRTIDNYSVVLQGPDKDVLYEVIDQIVPTVADGRLTGFTIDGVLANGLTSLAEPSAVGFESGAFPMLTVRGSFSITVQPQPALTVMAGWGGSFEAITIGTWRGWLHRRRDSRSLAAYVALDPHTTLIVESITPEFDQEPAMTEAQFLAAVAAIQLVDEATWRQRYDPELPIVPRFEGVVSAATSQPG